MIRSHYDADGDRTCGEGGCRQKLGRCSLHRKRGASALNNSMAMLGTVDFVREGNHPTAACSDGVCRGCGYYVCSCRGACALKAPPPALYGDIAPSASGLRAQAPFQVGDRVALKYAPHHPSYDYQRHLTVMEREPNGDMRLAHEGRAICLRWRDYELVPEVR